MMRTDPWGHRGCAEAEGCKANKMVDCDDKKPCTADLCEPTKGCVHKAIAKRP